MIKLGSGESVFEIQGAYNESADFSMIIIQALSYVKSDGRDLIKEEVYLGRSIGQVNGEDYKSLVVDLKRSNEGDGYILQNAFIGHISPNNDENSEPAKV